MISFVISSGLTLDIISETTLETLVKSGTTVVAGSSVVEGTTVVEGSKEGWKDDLLGIALEVVGTIFLASNSEDSVV